MVQQPSELVGSLLCRYQDRLHRRSRQLGILANGNIVHWIIERHKVLLTRPSLNIFSIELPKASRK